MNAARCLTGNLSSACESNALASALGMRSGIASTPFRYFSPLAETASWK
jgi:hypothetical protein